MTVAVLRPEGDVRLVDVLSSFYSEAVLPPFKTWASEDFLAAPNFERRDYRDSGCVTEREVPVWTADGRAPEVSPRGWRLYQRTDRLWAHVCVTRRELALSRLSEDEIVWRVAEPMFSQKVNRPVLVRMQREYHADTDETVRFLAIAEGRIPLPSAGRGESKAWQ